MVRTAYLSLAKRLLRQFPAIAILGPRQCGKTTLAKKIVKPDDIYLDLEKPSDLAKLQADAEGYLEGHRERLICLDEIQRVPELFPLLRSLIDSPGKKNKGRFLILGSASPNLLRQASESLAGRIARLELTPFTLPEVSRKNPQREILRHWLAGGFPLSFLAQNATRSFRWRQEYIQSHLERDLPGFGVRIPAVVLRRFWTMLAHSHGTLWNASQIAASLGVSYLTAKHYLDILTDTLMVRQLPPYLPNLKKRLVKSPKVYLRDSGLLHALLDISGMEQLLGHPKLGLSWEGYVIEQAACLLAQRPVISRMSFWATHGGAELDSVIETNGKRYGLEVKYTRSPAMTKSLHIAARDLGLTKTAVVYTGRERYPLAPKIEALPLELLDEWLGD